MGAAPEGMHTGEHAATRTLLRYPSAGSHPQHHQRRPHTVRTGAAGDGSLQLVEAASLQRHPHRLRILAIRIAALKQALHDGHQARVGGGRALHALRLLHPLLDVGVDAARCSARERGVGWRQARRLAAVGGRRRAVASRQQRPACLAQRTA